MVLQITHLRYLLNISILRVERLGETCRVFRETLVSPGENNLGFQHVPLVPYVLLLNSDTIVHQGCLRRCIDVLKANPRIGAMSCKLLMRTARFKNVARRFPHPFRITPEPAWLHPPLASTFWLGESSDPNWDGIWNAVPPVGWVGPFS